MPARRARLALLVLAGWSALILAATGAPAAPRLARTAAKPARTAPRAAPPDSVRALAVPAPERAAFDSTRGDSFAESQLFLSWKAPYGEPGARTNLDLTCGDTSEVDTLYLTFETGRDLRGFFGGAGKLRVHPAVGDTLGPFWRTGAGGPNSGTVRFQFDPDSTFPCPQPWVRPGISIPSSEFRPWGSEYSFIHAVILGDQVPISGRTRYCFGRMLFEQRRCWLPGARQPVCIEWVSAVYSGGGLDIPIESGSARYVTLNSPDGSVSGPYRSAQKPRRWTFDRVKPGPAPTAPPGSTGR